MVWVDDDEREDYPLPMYSKEINHSPDGFEWGYGGSGPSQLAYALLRHFTNDQAKAGKLYQEFKRDFIQNLHTDEWTIPVQAIGEWISIRDHIS